MPVSESIPVPKSVMKHVQNLFLPGEDFESIFSELDYALNPAAKNSIWTKDTTVTVVPKSKINSIDRYFPKISKEEPFETCSLSQSEKLYGNKTFSPADKTINLESERSADLSSISDDETSDNNEEAIFHSTAIGKLHVNQKFIKDYSIDLGNAAEEKTPVGPQLELSDSGSDTSDSENGQNHVGVKSKCNEKHSSSSKSSSSEDSLSEKSKTKEQHSRGNSPDKTFFIEDNTSDKSPLYKRVTGSKDLSNLIVEDTKLSSEEDETNNDGDATIKISNSEANEPYIARDIPENDVHQTCAKQSESQSSDEEIIQPSQDPVSPRFDLSSRRKNSMYIKSFLISKDKSKNNDDKDSMDSQDSVMEKTSMSPGWDLSEILSKSRIKKLKTKLVPVTELQCDSEIDPLQIEGLTEENDLFLIQCPTEIDPKFFIDKEIQLSGVSSVTLGNLIKPVKYDYFTIEGPSQKPVDVLLPNQNWTKIQIGRFNLAGNTILSESVDEPEPRTPAISPLKMGLLSPIRSLIKQESSSTTEQKKLEDSDMSSEEEEHAVPEVPSSALFSLSQKNNSSLKSTKQKISTEDSDSSEWQSVYDPESTKGKKKTRRTLSLTEGTDATKFKTPPLSPSKAPPPSESLENLTLGPFEESLGTNPEADLLSSKLQTPQKESKSDSCCSSSEQKRSRGLKNIFPAAHSQKIKQPSEAITSPSRHKTELSREMEDLSQDAQSFEPFPVSERIHSPFKVQEERSEEKQDVLSPSQCHEAPFSPPKSKRTPKKEKQDVLSPSQCHEAPFSPPKSKRTPKKEKQDVLSPSQCHEAPFSPPKSKRTPKKGFPLTLPEPPEATLSTHINSSPLKSSRRGVYIIPDNETPDHTSSSINSDSSSYHKNSAGDHFILPGKPKPVSARKSHPVSFPLELEESSSESEYILSGCIESWRKTISDIPQPSLTDNKSDEEINPVDIAVPEDLAVSDTVFSSKTSSIFTSETTDANKKKKKKISKEEYPVDDNESIAMSEVLIVSDELALDEKECAFNSETKKKKKKRKTLKEYPEDDNANINLPEALTVPDEFAEPETNLIFTSEIPTLKKKKKKKISRSKYPEDEDMDINLPEALKVPDEFAELETNLIFTSEIPTSKKKKKKKISREYPEDEDMDINLPEALTVPDEFAEPETNLIFTSEIPTSKKKKKKKISREYPEDDNADNNLPEALTVPDEFAEPETNLIFTSEIPTSKKKKKKKISREYPVDDNVYSALPADLAVPDSDCKSSAITDSSLKRKKKKRKRSLDENLENEPQSSDMCPPSEEIIFHKKKKHRPEEENLNNKFQPTSQYPVIISSDNEVSSHKKKTKKKKLKSEEILSLEEPVEYEPEFAGITPSFEEVESSTGGIKYKTEVEFVVHELKPSNLINSDSPNSIKKEKKKKTLQVHDYLEAVESAKVDEELKNPLKKKKRKEKKKDDASSVAIQNLLQDAYTNFNKKLKKKNKLKGSQAGPLAEVDPLQQIIPDDSLLSDKKVEKKITRKKNV